MAELVCEGVAKSYRGRPVLCDVDLEVPTGTLTAILGASGSGKTTLLRVIMGFVEADAGRVVVGGETVAQAGSVHLAADRRAIGYVAQEGALFPHLSAGENVGFGLPRAERKQGARIVQALELVGLDASYAQRPSHELSGGEQRRVALARALAPRPRIVLLDEPFSGLDAGLRAETRDAVLHALREEHATAVLVTHDQAEALSMGREVAVLREGRLAQRAAPGTLYSTPVDTDVARFVGEANIVPGEASAGQVQCALGRLNVLNVGVDGPVETLIRPEQIAVSVGVETGRPRAAGARAGGASAAGANDDPSAGADGRGVRARVTEHVYYGADTVLGVTLEDRSATVVKARVSGQEAPAPGEAVRLDVRGPVVVFPVQRTRTERA
jgi:iron(III) transport system ATP-binding protein